MATEDEAREAADGTEVQAEAMDLGTDHFQTHPEGKLPSTMEIKTMGEITDSIEGTLEIPEDQVLVEAPSEVELPLEHNLNCTASSLNGYTDKEEKISNEQLHENSQEEAELEGTNADQSNGINKEEATNCLSHGESTTEDGNLLKHEKEAPNVTMDDDVERNTLKTDNAIGPTVDGQQEQDLEPAKATEDTNPASTATIPDVGVVAEATSGVQTPGEHNPDDFDAIPDAVERNTNTDESAKPNDIVHLDHGENFPEDTSEVVKVEDQQRQHADAMDADVVEEEVPKLNETDVQEEPPKSEDADEPTTDAQEVLNQESAEETIVLENKKAEEIENQSNMAAPEEIMPEHDEATRESAADIQVQNRESIEAESVDTEAAMQQSSVSFEEAIPEDPHNLGVTMDDDKVQEDTLNAIEQTDYGQKDQDLEPAKAIEDTLPASTANIPDIEVVAEAPSVVQTPVEPSLNNSDSIPDTKDDNTETDKPAKVDSVIHLDHKENFPEDTIITEHTDEVVKVEDQQSKQADAMNADVVQEVMPESEIANDSTTDAKEVLNQESAEETNGLVTEKTAYKSNMTAAEETTSEHDATMREPDVNIQEQNQESLEAEDAEVEMQQRNAAFEEAIPEDNVAIAEPCSDIQHVHDVEPEEINGPADTEDEDITNKSNAENAVKDNILPSEPTTDIQLEQEFEQTGTNEMDDASDQTHAVVFNDPAQEDAIAVSEAQVTETEVNIEGTETQEITEHGHVSPSKERLAEDGLTVNVPYDDNIHKTLEQGLVEVKDNEVLHEKTFSTSKEDTTEDSVTAEGPTCDSQEVGNVESKEEIKEKIAENITEVSNVAVVDEADEEENVLRAGDIAENYMPELTPEETKNTETVETASAQEDYTPASDKQQIVSETEIKEIQETKTKEIPKENNACVFEEASPEDNHGTQKVNIMESSEMIEGDRDIITGEISDQNNMIYAGELAQDHNIPVSEPSTDIQQVQGPETDEIKNTELVEVNETCSEINDTIFQTLSHEDDPTTIEFYAIESEREVSNTEATEVKGAQHESNADQSEEQATEENKTESEPQILEQESFEKMNDTEATKLQSQQSTAESVQEEIATEDNMTTEQDVHHQQQESAEFKETEADRQIASSSTISTSEDSPSEDNATAIEPSSDTQADNLHSAEVAEDAENSNSNTALAEEVAPEEHVETEAIDTSPVQEPDTEDTKDTEPVGTEDNITSSELPSEEMDTETMETEATPCECHVASVKKLTEDDTLTSNTTNADIQSVLEQESVENTMCTDTTDPGEPPKIIGSTSDEPTLTEENTAVAEQALDTQEQNLKSQEIKDSEDAKTDQLPDHNSFPTPEEADKESNLTRIETLSEETRGIELLETEDHQQHRISTLDEPAVDNEPNVDNQYVNEDILPELKDNEAVEAELIFKQSNIAAPDNATEERSELKSDSSNVQPEHEVELSRESENSELVKSEETSVQSNTAALEETTTEDSVGSEIDPKQEHEQELVEEIKGMDATEAEEGFQTNQADATEKLASENNKATIEPNYDIQQADLEATKDMDDIEATNDEGQTEIANSEDPSLTHNGTASEKHPVESNEEKMGNEIDDVILAHGIKDEMQTPTELKDDACDLGETALKPQERENTTDEDAGQCSCDDTLETLNNIHQIEEDQKDGTEHNSSQMSSEPNGENITHVQNRDIKGDYLIERGTAEASQALFESDSQAAQDATEKDDTTKGSEQTSEHDNRQPGDVGLQLQTYEMGSLSIEKQDEDVAKVGIDQKQKQDEEIGSQKEEFEADEQKNEDKMNDFTTEPVVEPHNIENGTTNRTENTDAFEIGQTEAVISEIAKNEQDLHVLEESTPGIMDMTVENIQGTDEGTEDSDVKSDNKDEQENADKDNVVAKISTDELEETIDEIANKELEPGMASSVQEASDQAPSNDQILENDPVAITQNIESGVHKDDKECTNKVNDDVSAIQASEKEIADEMEENKEMQNEDNTIQHDESQSKLEEEEAPQLCSNESYDMHTKINDTATPSGEIVHDNTSIHPKEIEEVGDNKGLDSISKPFVELSIQNNVEQDLSKVEDKKISATEENTVDIEGMQEKLDESASDINQAKQCQEEISTDNVMQFETEENSFDKIDGTISNEQTETSNTTAIETVEINEDITDKASEADGALPDESHRSFNDTRRDLDISSAITAPKGESMNENMEAHKIAIPAHPSQDQNTSEQMLCIEETERKRSSSEKLLCTEPEENQTNNELDEGDIRDENQIPNEQNEEDMQETEVGVAQKEVEQELPVSHFLMNLILRKENDNANENSEPEAETKQETTEDNSCLLISKQEESIVSFSTDNKVEDKLTFEQEKHDAKCSEETQDMVKEQSPDVKTDTERIIEYDEFTKNTHDLKIPAHQDNSQGEISGELLSEEAAGIAKKMETRDIEILNVELVDKEDEIICQENTEVSTKIEHGSLKNLNDLTNTKYSREDSLVEGEIGPLGESLLEDKRADAVSEQTPLLSEPGMTDAKDTTNNAESILKPVFSKQVNPTESSSIEAKSTPDIQLDSEEVDDKEEKQQASTATVDVSEEHVEGLQDKLQKSKSSEATFDEQVPQITEPSSDAEMTLAHEKEISGGSACLDGKENANFSKGVENFQSTVDIQADGPNTQINQDKQDEATDNGTAMEPEKLGESIFQEHQETGTEEKPPRESDEGKQQFLVKKEILTKKHDVQETVESEKQTVSTKSNEEQKLFDSKVQARDLDVTSPKEASEAEENFVGVTKQEFSTDEEQTPKADVEEKTYDKKTKDLEGTKTFADEADMKTEAEGAAQKNKKHSLLSGVGSKVKHQLAKVKKAIVGKPGHTKLDSPKS